MTKTFVVAVLAILCADLPTHRCANAAAPPPMREYFHSSAYLVFFDKNVSSINVQARKTIVNAEVTEKHWGGNCIEVRGLSDTHEQDPVALSIQRATNVSSELRFDGLKLPIHLSGVGSIGPISRRTDSNYDPSKNQRVELIWLLKQPNQICS